MEQLTPLEYRRLYSVWTSMKYRCNSARGKIGKTYRNRGIKVCPEWERSFETFKRWAINHGYKELTYPVIDRIDNDKGYCPENCRWVTPQQSQQNKRPLPTFTAFGESKTLHQWSLDPRCVVSYATLNRHHKKHVFEDVLLGKYVSNRPANHRELILNKSVDTHSQSS